MEISRAEFTGWCANPPTARYGAHRLAYQAVYIRGGVCRREAQDTLFHELLHAVDSHLRLELTEGQIYGLAAGLLDILWGNPKLAKWIIRSAE